MFSEGLRSTPAPSSRFTRPADDPRPASAPPEDADLVWPPQAPIDAYDFEKQQFVSLQTSDDYQAPARSAPPPAVFTAYEDPGWRDLLAKYRRPFEILVTSLAFVAVVETLYLGIHFVAARHANNQPAGSAAALENVPTSPAARSLESAAPASRPAETARTGPIVEQAVASNGQILEAPPRRKALLHAAKVSPVAARLGIEPAPKIPAPPGWVSLSLPIQVQIFEHGNFVGTSSNPVLLAAGPHDLDFVNDALQYRDRQFVRVRPGGTTPLVLALPTGRLQVNALPWSEVLIDGERVGDTPLGNLRVPIGPHHIVFRHPQLGEQTRSAVIVAGGLTRLSVDLRQ